MLTKSVFPQQRLCQLLRERSVERGDFVLASGRRSSFYIDARRTTMSGEGLALVGPLALERFAARGWEPRFVGGLTLGADPVAFAIAAAAHAGGHTLDAFTVRKQPKTHGAARRIEGCFAAGAAAGRTKPKGWSSASRTSRPSRAACDGAGGWWGVGSSWGCSVGLTGSSGPARQPWYSWPGERPSSMRSSA